MFDEGRHPVAVLKQTPEFRSLHRRGSGPQDAVFQGAAQVLKGRSQLMRQLGPQVADPLEGRLQPSQGGIQRDHQFL